MEARFQDQLDFLRARGADSTPHSRTTLLEHLAGTRALLAAWGNDADTCAAGLFHSVYGTYVFAHAIVGRDEREAVRAVIGPRAEALAWLFGTTDRRTFFDGSGALASSEAGGARVAVDEDTLSRLVEIEVADTVEQLPRRKPARQLEYEWYREAFERHLARLSDGAVAAFRRAFAEARAARERNRAEPAGG